MDDSLMLYIMWGVVCILAIWFTMRKRYPDSKDLTPELLRRQRAKMTMSDYKKWLRLLYTMFSARTIERKERGMSIPRSLINSLHLIEEERGNIAQQSGEHFLERKSSEEIQQYRRIDEAK